MLELDKFSSQMAAVLNHQCKITFTHTTLLVSQKDIILTLVTTHMATHCGAGE